MKPHAVGMRKRTQEAKRSQNLGKFQHLVMAGEDQLLQTPMLYAAHLQSKGVRERNQLQNE